MYSKISSSPFAEHPVCDITSTEANEFDISIFDKEQVSNFVSSGKFLLNQYCACLLHKMYSLPKSKVKAFLQYQCQKVNNPFEWLNKLEKLIDINRTSFSTTEHQSKTEKALIIIELLRQDIESNKNTNVKYDFNILKKQAKQYTTYEEKLSCLMEARTEYLQNKPKVIDVNEVPFDEKIDLEIQLLKTKNKLGKARSAVFTEKKSPLSPPQGTSEKREKFRLNTNLNKFVDLFFQLMYEKKTGNRAWLEAAPNELSEMIAKYFVDKDGKAISVDTIKTILKPSRYEKRPKGSNRINIID